MAVNHRVRGSSPCWGAIRRAQGHATYGVPLSLAHGLTGPILIRIGPFCFKGYDMAYWVYVIQSETTGKLYIGQTSNLEERIDRHNSDYGKDRYTRKQEGPWELVYSEELETRSAAIRRERFFKSGGGRAWIKAHVLKR